MPDNDFEKKVEKELRADSRMEYLLPILDEEIDTLVKEGQTNLSHFLMSLESHGLLLSDDAMELRAKFDLAIVSHDARSRFMDVSDKGPGNYPIRVGGRRC